MTEIWVPYGQVEVSFDVKQENLSQIVEPQSQKLSQEDFERKALDSSGADSILLLSQTEGVCSALDSILAVNKTIKKLLYPKHLAAVARRKAEQFLVPDIELFDANILAEAPESTQPRIPLQLKQNPNIAILSTTRYDPLFGLAGAASDLISLNLELKSQAFKNSIDEIPCPPSGSSASLFATRVIQECPNASIVEVVEKTGTGALNIFTGEPEATHSKSVDYWRGALSVNLPTRHERILFGCGGKENDRTLHHALSRSFFNVAKNVALVDSDSKVCMLAECSEGLGSDALLKYITGTFVPGSNLDEIQYIDGLEVLLSLIRVQKDLDVSMVTTLPSYYCGRLGFKPISAARDAPSSIVSQGSRAKMLIVPDASATFFTGPV